MCAYILIECILYIFFLNQSHRAIEEILRELLQKVAMVVGKDMKRKHEVEYIKIHIFFLMGIGII